MQEKNARKSIFISVYIDFITLFFGTGAAGFVSPHNTNIQEPINSWQFSELKLKKFITQTLTTIYKIKKIRKKEGFLAYKTCYVQKKMIYDRI